MVTFIEYRAPAVGILSSSSTTLTSPRTKRPNSARTIARSSIRDTERVCGQSLSRPAAMQSTHMLAKPVPQRCIVPQQPWMRVRSCSEDLYTGSTRVSARHPRVRWSHRAPPCCSQATSLERVKPQRFERCCAAKSAPPSTQAGKRDAAIRQDVFDVIATARSKTALKSAAPADSAAQEVR